MGTKHTPGPWAAKTLVNCHAVVVGNRILASSESDEFEQARADIALMAAAPELLNALNNLQANPNDPRAHRMAFDAITKATGGAAS